MLFKSCFFFNDTATTEIYTLSQHDALPISILQAQTPTAAPLGPVSKTRYWESARRCRLPPLSLAREAFAARSPRSEEHTSELQSRLHLVCRLLLEKKNRSSADTAPALGVSD